MFRGIVWVALLLAVSVSAQTDTCSRRFTDKLLSGKRNGTAHLHDSFFVKEIKTFSIKKIPMAVILENGFGQSKLKNPHLWKPDYNKIEVTNVEMIFSKYPNKGKDWDAGFNKLLGERLKALFDLDPRLNCQRIKYSILVQTAFNCDSMARAAFHGIVIKYKRAKKKPIVKPVINKDSLQKISYHKQVEQFIKDQGGLQDSTAFKVFDRHPEWKKSLIVMDWTSSMYPYGASVVLWHALHHNSSGIKFYTFFNDGDNKPEYAKVMGYTGGIYHAEADDLDEVIKLFRLVMRKGTGGDIAENDIEALIEAQKEYPNFNQLILIADNSACVRDFKLSDSIKVPVKIILCGTSRGINPMFLNLAAKTRGSLHTIEEDILLMADSMNQDHIVIGGWDFSKNMDGIYVPTDPKREMECMQYYDFNREQPQKQVPKDKKKQNDLPKPDEKLSAWQRLLKKLRL
ncbi:MAG: hypothetical protein EXR21_01540 [Flavobacteriaceae bacterium]|nr:hypothetical protein [Flavobacteriaceae bacterium]